MFLSPNANAEYSPVFVKTLGLLCILLFLFFILFFIYKILDDSPGLIINQEGIIDNSSFTSAGLMRWKNITDVYIMEIQGIKVITVKVNNEDELLSKQSGLKKLLMYLNAKHFGSPIHISTLALKNFNTKELLSLMRSRIRKFEIGNGNNKS